MGDRYGNLNYSENNAKDAEINELKESHEKIRLIIYNFNKKNNFGFIFSFLMSLICFGLILYLFIAATTGSGTVSNAPIGTILAWVPKPENTSSNILSIPDGWMPCDGSPITQGQWKGGRTPDLNSVGAFLRGGTEDLVLEMEDSQIEDHQHDYNASYIMRVY